MHTDFIRLNMSRRKEKLRRLEPFKFRTFEPLCVFQIYEWSMGKAGDALVRRGDDFLDRTQRKVQRLPMCDSHNNATWEATTALREQFRPALLSTVV